MKVRIYQFIQKILKGEIKSKETNVSAIKKYVEAAKAKSELDRMAETKKKTGVFSGFYAINDLNDRRMPVWISDFVLIGFGTGAVIGVPGHDIRDFEFAKEFGIEIISKPPAFRKVLHSYKSFLGLLECSRTSPNLKTSNEFFSNVTFIKELFIKLTFENIASDSLGP